MIDLADRPAWLYELNPVGRVPVVEEDGWALPESAVINEFLEERYPEPPLLPADPGARAAARLQDLPRQRLHRPYYDLRRGAGRSGGRVRGRARRSSTRRSPPRPFLTGEAFGLADIALVPWVIRARDMLGVSLDAVPARRRAGSRASPSGRRSRPRSRSSPRL